MLGCNLCNRGNMMSLLYEIGVDSRASKFEVEEREVDWQGLNDFLDRHGTRRGSVQNPMQGLMEQRG